MKKIINPGLIYVLILLSFSCVSSKVQTVSYNCSPKPYALYITEFNLPHEKMEGNFAFDKSDFNDIRESIIKSLNQNNCFSSIIDEMDLNDSPNKGTNDVSLSVEFNKIQVLTKMFTFESCIDAQISIIGSNDKILKNKTINIKKSSALTVSDAKNKSIQTVTEEVFKLLNKL